MNTRAVLKGTAAALIMTVIFIVITAVINTFSPQSDKTTGMILMIGVCIAVAISSYGVSGGCEKLKLLNSVCVGIGVMICICILSLFVCGGISFGVKFFTTLVCCICSAGVGSFISG